MSAIMEIEVVGRVRNFRVMLRVVLDAILSFTETNRFSKGSPVVGVGTSGLSITTLSALRGKQSSRYGNPFANR